MIVSADRINQLKEEVKNECLRRSKVSTTSGSFSMTSYAGTEYDYTNVPAANRIINKEHKNKILDPLKAINTSFVKQDGTTGNLPPRENVVITDIDIATMQSFLTLCESQAIEDTTASNNRCSGGCTGTCFSTCTGGCTASCTSTCAQGCANDCTGSCTSTCAQGCSSSCSSGNACRGSCTGGCSTTCRGDCDGTCSGTCSGGCDSTCTGSCSGAACGAACESYCASNGCYGQTCKVSCSSGNTCRGGCQLTCSGSCGSTCTGGSFTNS